MWFACGSAITHPARPLVREAAPDPATGRGLLIIDQLASRWGVDLRRDGKTVWVELDL